MTKRNIIFVDIDGTINEFNMVDNNIIKEIFGNHRLVMFCDRLLWKINELDLISNSMRIFKLRIFLYSLLSFTSYNKKMLEYEKKYIKYTFEEVRKNYNLHLMKLKRLGYEIRLVTHSEFTKYFKKDYPISILKNKPKYIERIHKKNGISYMIGNNYTDDLKVPLKFGIKTIYIGKSKLVKRIIKDKAKSFLSIELAVNDIINESRKK